MCTKVLFCWLCFNLVIGSALRRHNLGQKTHRAIDASFFFFFKRQREKRQGFLTRLQPFAVTIHLADLGSRLPVSVRLSVAGRFWVSPTARPGFRRALVWSCSRVGEHQNSDSAHRDFRLALGLEGRESSWRRSRSLKLSRCPAAQPAQNLLLRQNFYSLEQKRTPRESLTRESAAAIGDLSVRYRCVFQNALLAVGISVSAVTQARHRSKQWQYFRRFLTAWW